MHRTITPLCLLALVGASAVSAADGSVVPLNPTQSIVNIDARANGAASYNGPQTLWYQPFSSSGVLPSLAVGTGTYTFKVIRTADYAQANYTAWTYNSPWITNYLVFDASALTNSSQPQILYGAPSTVGQSNATAAYNQAAADGILTSTYNFTSPTTIYFAIPDNGLSDNNGGMSILVTSPVPEPASLAAIGLGLSGLMLKRRAKR